MPKRHVLVVDDDADNRSSLAMLLVAQGMEVSQCASGKAALAHLSRPGNIGLIVSDVAMPEMDGIEFAAHARELHPEIPLLLLTGHDSLVDRVIAEGSLAILKPYEPARLVELVEEVFLRAEVGARASSGSVRPA